MGLALRGALGVARATPKGRFGNAEEGGGSLG